MKAERLAALRKLAAEATPGPWHRGYRYMSAGVNPSSPSVPRGKCTFCDRYELHSVVKDGYRHPDDARREDLHHHIDPDPSGVEHKVTADNVEVVCGNYDYDSGGVIRGEDAAFIAAARTAVPELLEEVERLTAERGDWCLARVLQKAENDRDAWAHQCNMASEDRARVMAEASKLTAERDALKAERDRLIAETADLLREATAASERQGMQEAFEEVVALLDRASDGLGVGVRLCSDDACDCSDSLLRRAIDALAAARAARAAGGDR